MQVRISNVSKLAGRESLFTLLSFVGDILYMERVPSAVVVPPTTASTTEVEELPVAAEDWVCLFANVGDAQRACKLSPLELGDCTLYVEPSTSLYAGPGTTASSSLTNQDKCRTALFLLPKDAVLNEEKADDLESQRRELKARFPSGLCIEPLTHHDSINGFFVEFATRSELMNVIGKDVVDASTCFRVAVSGVKEPKLYGVPASKLLSVRTHAPGQAIPATPLPPSASRQSDERRHLEDRGRFDREHSDRDRSSRPDRSDRSRSFHDSSDRQRRRSRSPPRRRY